MAALGIENQTTIDKDMPIRVMGYDYTAYQEQIKNSDNRVPVITIVLNFSKTKWTSPLSLKQILQIPEELAEYVQDYKIQVFNIAHLPRKVRNQFTSDFKVVADYFSEKESPDYQPGNEEIQQMIVNMLLDNQSPEQISKYAGCSVEHVYQVKEMMAVKSN